MGEALLKRRLGERGIDSRVKSAGLMPGGSPATDPAIEVMAAVGLDISRHRSRQITEAVVGLADLVVTMTRQHLIELTLMAPDAWPRMFQIRDLVRRAQPVGPRPPEQSFEEWLEKVGDGRTRSGILAASLSDDIADPIGQSDAVYERTRDELDELLTRLAELL
ncbi:MAG: protein-tyrosine phosphatase [Acidimicrobiaceae bacterium]|jgi:protein-tyrosine phosphatase|nr:protein-tyrosine phosphatase [Acidimicrobiaceae bacterium]